MNFVCFQEMVGIEMLLGKLDRHLRYVEIEALNGGRFTNWFVVSHCLGCG